MKITLQQLKTIMPYSGQNADKFLDALNVAMSEFSINTPQRIAAFLAQIAHESGSLRFVKEIASGTAYEGRRDLGNILPGDGAKYKGRGLIQVTGKTNYTAVMLALNIDCLEHPELLEQPINACRSAAWFWQSHGLNQLVDSNTEDSFTLITKRINGGMNGFRERLEYWKRAKKVLGVKL
jgi:putative chitinase